MIKTFNATLFRRNSLFQNSSIFVFCRIPRTNGNPAFGHLGREAKADRRRWTPRQELAVVRDGVGPDHGQARPAAVQQRLIRHKSVHCRKTYLHTRSHILLRGHVKTQNVPTYVVSYTTTWPCKDPKCTYLHGLVYYYVAMYSPKMPQIIKGSSTSQRPYFVTYDCQK